MQIAPDVFAKSPRRIGGARLRLAAHDGTVPEVIDGPHFHASPLRVLLVEDYVPNQLVVCAILAQWGILPEIACDGMEAVECAREQVFDFILMDLDLPLMNGLVATSCIRRYEMNTTEPQRVPVIAYSSSSLASNQWLLQQNGIDDVLPKPCTPGSMHACLERWCAGLF